MFGCVVNWPDGRTEPFEATTSLPLRGVFFPPVPCVGHHHLLAAERLRSLAGPAARNLMPRKTVMPARSSGTLCSADSNLNSSCWPGFFHLVAYRFKSVEVLILEIMLRQGESFSRQRQRQLCCQSRSF